MAARKKKTKAKKAKKLKWNFESEEEGRSCHHCKKKSAMKQMMRCVTDHEAINGKKGVKVGSKRHKLSKNNCIKKYCRHCLETFYPKHAPTNGKFVCPSCLGTCRCASCRRKKANKKMRIDHSQLKNEAMEYVVLDTASLEGTKVEIGQVHGLLEIMEARPDIQGIVKQAMQMKFEDDNAKVLYIGHLIDRALTRPDMLALYYKTGK